MRDDSRTGAERQAEWPTRDTLVETIRGAVHGMIEQVVEQELEATLGLGRYERGEGRAGYRHGHVARILTTPLGPTRLRVPRGRLRTAAGRTVEWASHSLRRYARRMVAVDAAVLGCYFGGVNTRRVKTALRPLLHDAPLSKSAISRLVGTVKGLFDAWRTRDLRGERIAYLYLDAIHLPMRVAGRVSRLPVLVAMGVRVTGHKVLLALQAAGSESEAAWRGMLEDLVARGLSVPRLVIIDGSKGLRAAVAATWPAAPVQRCTVHKLCNLLGAAPRHAHDEVRADFHAVVYAESLGAAQTAYARMRAKWTRLAPAVAASLAEGGEELLTFFQFPRAQWKSLRTTNGLERLNLEFRRRVKTQAALPTSDAALVVLFGLVASGQVRLRRIDGWADLDHVVSQPAEAAA